MLVWMRMSFTVPVVRTSLQPRSSVTPSPRIPLRVVPTAARAASPVRPAAPSDSLIAPVARSLHTWLLDSPRLNNAISNVTAPFVKAVGNLAGPFIVKDFFNPFAKPPETPAPDPLKRETIKAAERIMADRFRPAEGKVIIGISGSGAETVHCFVVSDVKPNGRVTITHAIPSYSNRAENYAGIGGAVRELLDRVKGNDARALEGVTEHDWATYAAKSKRNTLVLLELEANPEAIEQALQELKTFVGRPYDSTLLAGEKPTAASTAAFYCTELSSWFINRLRPGTVKMSSVKGYPIFQVADHMRATEIHGGPLKVLYNGENRLDVAGLNPIPRNR